MSTPHLRIRLDPRLLARLEKSRAKAERTLTGEIAERLEQSFRKDDTEARLRRILEEWWNDVTGVKRPDDTE